MCKRRRRNLRECARRNIPPASAATRNSPPTWTGCGNLPRHFKATLERSARSKRTPRKARGRLRLRRQKGSRAGTTRQKGLRNVRRPPGNQAWRRFRTTYRRQSSRRATKKDECRRGCRSADRPGLRHPRSTMQPPRARSVRGASQVQGPGSGQRVRERLSSPKMQTRWTNRKARPKGKTR